MRTAFPLLVLLAVGACGRETPVPEPVTPAMLLSAAPRLAHALVHGASPTCEGPKHAPVPAHVLVVTAKQCLTCREVGFAARRLERHARQTARTLVVAPRADSLIVCRAMRKERVHADVFLLPDTLITWSRQPADLLYFTVDSAGAASGVHTARNGLALLDTLGVG